MPTCLFSFGRFRLIWELYMAWCPPPLTPCPAGQGYMAVHWGSHNSAALLRLPPVSTNVRHAGSRGEERRMQRRAALAGIVAWCPSRTGPPAKNHLPLNCEHPSWSASAGNSLICLFYKAVGTRRSFPRIFPLWILGPPHPTNSSIWTQASHC